VPTYQYVCTNPEDKHEFEVVQSFSDPSVTECPQCGSPVRKVYGSVGVVFKGSGFYRTDSRGKPAKADGDGDKAKKPADATSSSKSSTSEGGGSTSKPKAAEKSA
jgi:putative FmdB family regulatory protein